MGLAATIWFAFLGTIGFEDTEKQVLPVFWHTWATKRATQDAKSLNAWVKLFIHLQIFQWKFFGRMQPRKIPKRKVFFVPFGKLRTVSWLPGLAETGTGVKQSLIKCLHFHYGVKPVWPTHWMKETSGQLFQKLSSKNAENQNYKDAFGIIGLSGSPNETMKNYLLKKRLSNKIAVDRTITGLMSSFVRA